MALNEFQRRDRETGQEWFVLTQADSLGEVDAKAGPWIATDSPMEERR